MAERTYHRHRATVVRPTSRFGRWTLRLTTEGDDAFTLVSRSEIGYPGAWTQRGAERKALRHLRRLRRKEARYDLWVIDEKDNPRG